MECLFLVEDNILGSPLYHHCHWRIGARPPTGPNSFLFTHIFTKKQPRRRFTPLLTGPSPREILDPPLTVIIYIRVNSTSFDFTLKHSQVKLPVEKKPAVFGIFTLKTRKRFVYENSECVELYIM